MSIFSSFRKASVSKQHKSDEGQYQLEELREMLYQNVHSLNCLRKSLNGCELFKKAKKDKYIRYVDQFLIDLDEEIVDINGELGKSSYIDTYKVEEYRQRVNEIISSI